ncbi:basic proline-rich protein-like [Dermochelys coriacea]|uniref:basic proline-rich protein-like n=1 Tax=Dermochelys coriacea TaxID=27794 RepID=UPI0018E7E1E3|nr:basic proline-rich protein-like [Dermochelys coriacea]
MSVLAGSSEGQKKVLAAKEESTQRAGRKRKCGEQRRDPGQRTGSEGKSCPAGGRVSAAQGLARARREEKRRIGPLDRPQSRPFASLAGLTVPAQGRFRRRWERDRPGPTGGAGRLGTILSGAGGAEPGRAALRPFARGGAAWGRAPPAGADLQGPSSQGPGIEPRRARCQARGTGRGGERAPSLDMTPRWPHRACAPPVQLHCARAASRRFPLLSLPPPPPPRLAPGPPRGSSPLRRCRPGTREPSGAACPPGLAPAPPSPPPSGDPALHSAAVPGAA